MTDTDTSYKPVESWSWKATILWILTGIGMLGMALCVPVYREMRREREFPSFFLVLIVFAVFIIIGVWGIKILIKLDPVAARAFSRLNLADVLTIPIAAGVFVAVWKAIDVGWHPLTVAILFAGLQFWACMDSNRYDFKSKAVRIGHSLSSLATAFGVLMLGVIVVIIIWDGIEYDNFNKIWEVIELLLLKPPKENGSVRMFCLSTRLGVVFFIVGLIGRLITRMINRAMRPRNSNSPDGQS